MSDLSVHTQNYHCTTGWWCFWVADIDWFEMIRYYIHFMLNCQNTICSSNIWDYMCKAVVNSLQTTLSAHFNLSMLKYKGSTTKPLSLILHLDCCVSLHMTHLTLLYTNLFISQAGDLLYANTYCNLFSFMFRDELFSSSLKKCELISKPLW